MFIKFYDRIVNSRDISRIWIDRYKDEENTDYMEYSIMVETFSGDRFFIAEADGNAIGLMLYYMQRIFAALREDRDLDMDALSRGPLPSVERMKCEGISKALIDLVKSYEKECERAANDFSFGRGET